MGSMQLDLFLSNLLMFAFATFRFQVIYIRADSATLIFSLLFFPLFFSSACINKNYLMVQFYCLCFTDIYNSFCIILVVAFVFIPTYFSSGMIYFMFSASIVQFQYQYFWTDSFLGYVFNLINNFFFASVYSVNPNNCIFISDIVFIFRNTVCSLKEYIFRIST